MAKTMMEFMKLPENSELSIVFCDDDFIQKLNYQHLGKNRPTDVLAFPMENINISAGEHLLGDIIISVETAQRQAPRYNHSLSLEIIFLLIHGFLHLCNYNHSTASERKIMKQKELEILHHLTDKKLIKDIEKKSKDKTCTNSEQMQHNSVKKSDIQNESTKITKIKTKRKKTIQN